MARKAIASRQTRICAYCNDPIIPGDFVGVTADTELVHAGFHFTLSQKEAFCETAAIGIGYWNGEALIDPN